MTDTTWIVRCNNHVGEHVAQLNCVLAQRVGRLIRGER